jgi:hypothetical protein
VRGVPQIVESGHGMAPNRVSFAVRSSSCSCN